MTRCACLALAGLLGVASPAVAETQYALVVSGAAGGEAYSAQHAKWRGALVSALRERLGLPQDHIVLLADGVDGTPSATREEVRRAMTRLQQAAGPDDVLMVVLIGHGNADSEDAKFNLVGPDFSADDWRDLLRPVRAKVVFVDTTEASFPFLEKLSGPRRVVITATDSIVQRFVTVFPEYFAQALGDGAADIDKNGRVSIWEAFSAASQRVRQYYEQRGQLATERALLDDNGDGVGREAGAPGADGMVASRTYLDVRTGAEPKTDPVLVELLQRRAALEAQVEELRARKPLMPPADYAAEFERLMIELARVSRDIRHRKS
jgi:hypothetical protein